MSRLPLRFPHPPPHRVPPSGYHDPILEARKYVHINMPSAAGFKKEIPHEFQGESPFYHANMLGACVPPRRACD